jgi:PIN domain nuclease of toxin-antitoxin system
VKLLLDTHYVFGLAGSPATLSKRELRFLDDYSQPFVVSAVSIWEIRLKWQSLNSAGAPKGPLNPLDVVGILATETIVEFLTLTPEHAATELASPLSHKDPFDELLLAQAQAEGLMLLSRDRLLASHPLVTSVS